MSSRPEAYLAEIWQKLLKESTSIMLVDFTVRNFRSFEDENLFSMNVESGRNRLRSNFHEVSDGKLAVLKSAAILGPNASGKSNLLRAIRALKWIVCESHRLSEGTSLPTYEPFRLSEESSASPVDFEIEFIVPSGMRYRYSVSFLKNRITHEILYSFPGRQKALIFERGPEDSWESVKFGGTYKGGSRRIPFFKNNSYLSKAGNDASAPASIREISNYFRTISFVSAAAKLRVANYFAQDGHLEAVSDIICLADTGVESVTAEVRSEGIDLRLPEDMPEDLKEAIIQENSRTYKFWLRSKSGELVEFEEDEMSDGTIKLFEILPMLLNSISCGTPVLIDELDGHLHTNLVGLVLELFHDPLINKRGSQIIFTTHDTNVMNSGKLRRDQIWMTSKNQGASTLLSLDEYDKKLVRQDSPFEAFYLDGRFGALPSLSYSKIRDRLSKIVEQEGYFQDVFK